MKNRAEKPTSEPRVNFLVGRAPRAASYEWFLWPALMVLAIGLAFVVDNQYWLQVMVNAEVMIIAAVGLYVTFGLSGQVSLGQAAFYAIGGYTTGLLVTKLQWDMGPAILAGVGAGILVGIGLGIPALRLKGHYLALATLGFGQVVAMILINWKSLTEGARGVSGIAAPMIGTFELVSVRDWAIFVGILAVGSIFVVQRIRQSTFGRAMQAARDSDVAATAMGVSLPHVKVLAFTVGAGFAALAGSLNAGVITYISPGTYTLILSVAMLSMVVVGGASSHWGAVIGAVVIVFLPEVLRAAERFYLLFYGVLLLIIVAYLPGGLWNLITRFFRFIVSIFSKRQRTGLPLASSEGN